MSDLTRRGFVKNSAGAAAGMTVVGALVAAGEAEAKEGAVGSEPVVAYVKDPRKGDISLKQLGLELIVRVDGQKRTIVLPPALAAYRPTNASYEDGALEVRFDG